ncbi:MAG: sulfite exporter TauE/SafE family protein, partial [Actinomycetota bacterium]
PGAAAGTPAALEAAHWLPMLMVGGFVGALAALLGVGGGLVMVPALALLLGYDQHLAQGTSLAVIIPVSISGAYAHAKRGNVVWPLVGPMSLGAVLGAAVVANSVFKIQGPALQVMFGVFMLAVGIGMARSRVPERNAPLRHEDTEKTD